MSNQYPPGTAPVIGATQASPGFQKGGDYPEAGTPVRSAYPMPSVPAGIVPATPHGPDVPLMVPPTSAAPIGRSAIQPTLAPAESMHPDAKAPQVIAQAPQEPSDLQVISDQIVGSNRIITILAPSVERAVGNEARMMAWQQRMQGGWPNAGIEALDYYPVDAKGQLIQDRTYKGPYFYHSRWKLTLTG